MKYFTLFTNKYLGFLPLLITLLLASRASAATYYIDYAGGNDSNSGTSKSSPWKHHPWMYNDGSWTAHAYSHSAGDSFIFKGGVTVPGDVLVITITAGGSSGNQDYYGVDKSWYSGGAWSAPVLSEQGASVTYDYGYFNVEADYVTIDGFEMTDFYWGPADYGVYNDPYSNLQCIAIGAQNYITIKNCYFHGWTHDTFDNFYDNDPSASSMPAYTLSYDNLFCIRGNYGGSPNTGCVVSNCVFDGSASIDGDGNVSGEAVNSMATVIDCVITNMSNGIIPNGDPAEISGCIIGPIKQSFDVNHLGHNGTHENAIEPEGVVGTVLIHNNYIFTCTAACILVGDEGGPVYVYDNVIDESASGTAIPIQVTAENLEDEYPESTLYCYNNTLVLSDDVLAIRCVNETEPSDSWHLVAENNHTIGENATPFGLSDFQTDYTVDHNLIQSTSTATGDGYSSASLWQPTSASAPTVDAGTDLSSLSSTLPTIATDIFGVPRPQGSAWDIGAYEYRQLIDVQFVPSSGDGTSEQQWGLAAIGNSPDDYWNQAVVGDIAFPIDVTCSDWLGNSTSVVLELSGMNTPYPFSGIAVNAPLLQSGVSSPGGGAISFSLSLPTGTYDIYLYSPSYSGGQTIFSISTGASDLTTAANGYDINTYVEGNQYIVFRDVAATSGTPIVVGADQDSEVEDPMISGVQIVKH